MTATPQLLSWTLARSPQVADPDLRQPTGRTTRIIARAATRAAMNTERNLLVLVAVDEDVQRYTTDLAASGVDEDRITVLVTEPTGPQWSVSSIIASITGTPSLLVVDHYVWERMADQARYDDYAALCAAVEAEV